MQIAIIGTGYVGLVSGVCLADFGHSVVCVDKDSTKIEALKRGEIPIYEPGLNLLLKKNVDVRRISFTTDTQVAVEGADAVFIAVGTPTRRGDGHADLTYVYAAAREVATYIDGFTVIVNKSTVPVGTGDSVEKIIRETNPDADFEVVSNPEFLREGAAIKDFKVPDRVVVGTDSDRAADVMREVYRPLFLNETPILVTNRRTSELIKYAANSFLAMKISFINEIADLCEHVGGDVQEVSRGIGLDKRIGNKFLNAGPGYGGSCFPKDTLALIKTAQAAGSPMTIIEAVEAANKKRKANMADKVIAAVNGGVSGKTIAVLGLAFKPNTDDMRYSPSIDIITTLQKAGATIRAYDPEAMDESRKYLDEVTYTKNEYECAQGADALVIVTEWDQFRALDLMRLKNAMAQPILVDLRNIYRISIMEKLGIQYTGIGKGSSVSADDAE